MLFSHKRGDRFQKHRTELILLGSTHAVHFAETGLGRLQERLAKLSGGVAVIRVGAPSEAELKSRKEALEDAINATKAWYSMDK